MVRGSSLGAALLVVAVSPVVLAQHDHDVEMTVYQLVLLREGSNRTPIGERRIAKVTGGSFAGPELKGTILPGGGDWLLLRADGALPSRRGDGKLRAPDPARRRRGKRFC